MFVGIHRRARELRFTNKLIKRCRNIERNARNNHGQTLLIIACKSGQINIVKLQLDIDLNARYIDDDTAFMLACYYGYKYVV